MSNELSKILQRVKQYGRPPYNTSAKRKQADVFVLSIAEDLLSLGVSEEKLSEYRNQVVGGKFESVEHKLKQAETWIEQLIRTLPNKSGHVESAIVSQSPLFWAINSNSVQINLNYSGTQVVDQSKSFSIDASKHLEINNAFEQLTSALQKALDETQINVLDAQTIEFLANQLAKSLEQNNKRVIQINSAGLEEAARTVASIAPFVLNTALAVVELIRRTVGM